MLFCFLPWISFLIVFTIPCKVFLILSSISKSEKHGKGDMLISIMNASDFSGKGFNFNAFVQSNRVLSRKCDRK